MISSRNNPEVTEAGKLRSKRRRDSLGLFLIDGTKLLFEALESGVGVEKIFATQAWLDENGGLLPEDAPEPLTVSDFVMQKLSGLKTPEGVVGVARIQKAAPAGGPIVFLDGVQDPGNLGAIIRAADAAGFGGVVCSNGCADLYNEKTLRAAMGSAFHIGVARVDDLPKGLRETKDAGYQIIGADLKGEDIEFGKGKPTEKFAVVLGNESNGISQRVLEECDRLVKIPIRGEAESLNVSVAAGIIMYALTS